MNQTQYAKHFSISQQRVAKMLQQGIISNGVVIFKPELRKLSCSCEHVGAACTVG